MLSEVHDVSGSGAFVAGEDEGNGSARFFAGDHRAPVLAQCVGEVLDEAAVSFYADGFWVGGSSPDLACGFVFEDVFVAGEFIGEVPAYDPIVDECGGAVAAGDLDTEVGSWKTGGGCFDDAEGSGGEVEGCREGVLCLDVRVRATPLECGDAVGKSDEPLEQVDCVNPLVHEGATAVEFEGTFPRGRGVVLWGAPPLDVSGAEGEVSEALGEDGVFDDAGGAAQSVLEYSGEDAVPFFFSAEDGVDGVEGYVQRFLAEDGFSCFEDGDSGFGVSAAGSGDAECVDTGVCDE